MARDILKVSLQLDRIRCHDEGDGWGSAEPYLWMVFFKIDGEGVALGEDLMLHGSAVVHTTPGSHGNLGVSDVDEGDGFSVPEAIGLWEPTMKPIPVPESISGLIDDVGGVVGVACVLMEEDNVSDDGAEAGHDALNDGVEDAINQIIATLGFSNQEVSDDDINQFIGGISSAVEDAIKDQQNFFENIWSWLNADDQIGTKVFFFTHDQLADGNIIDFSHRWQNEGDWEIFGHVNATVMCPAEAVAGIGKIFDELAGAGAPTREIRARAAAHPAFQAMRAFRDKEFLQKRGLNRWWDLAKRHTPLVAYRAAHDPALREALKASLNAMPAVLKDRHAPLPDELVKHAHYILGDLVKNGTRRGRIDASRALGILEQARGKTVAEAIDLLASVEPSRHPRVAGGLRVGRPKLRG